VAEPEGAAQCLVGEKTPFASGDLCERGDALTTVPEAVAQQDLLHPRRREDDLAFCEMLEETACSKGWPGDRLREDDLDDVSASRSAEPSFSALSASARRARNARHDVPSGSSSAERSQKSDTWTQRHGFPRGRARGRGGGR